MSEIAYSTAVTADDINNLAVDLGATEFSQFQNAEPYAVQQLNNITKDLVTAGILLSLNRCRLTKTGDKVTIDTGIIVFKNGAKKRITEALQVDFVANTYIYALNDTATNTCQIVVSETEPDPTSDYVMLGQVDAGGNVLDKRSYSYGKHNPIASVAPFIQLDNSISVKSSMWDKGFTLEVGGKGFLYAAATGKGGYGEVVPISDSLDNASAASIASDVAVRFVRNGEDVDVYGKIVSGVGASTNQFDVYIF